MVEEVKASNEKNNQMLMNQMMEKFEQLQDKIDNHDLLFSLGNSHNSLLNFQTAKK